MAIELYHDQAESIEKVRAAALRGVKHILLQGATGSGKSIIGSEFCRRTLEKGNNLWFVVPRRDLIQQMSAAFKEFGIPHSFIASGHNFNPYERAHIVSLDTVRSRIDKLTPPKFAIIDETHFGGNTLDLVIIWLKAAGTTILGLSATPWRLDGVGLKKYYQEMVCGPSIRWLINNKRLADYRAFAPQQPNFENLPVVNGEYGKKQMDEYFDQDRVIVGNAIQHYKSHALGRLGVTFAVSVKQSQKIAQAYRDAGIPAAHMDGDTPMEERRQIAKAFARRELLQLCNAELLCFGYDLASASGVKGVRIECITDCQPTKSLAKQRQKNGRGLRYGEEPALFFDHVNNFKEHGLPCADIEWSLDDREKQRRGSSERTIMVTQCAAPCFFCYPSRLNICPECGTVREKTSREIEEVEGQLQEIKIIEHKKALRMEVGKARTIEDLRRIQQERGYNPRWIMKMMELKGISA